MKVMIKKAWNGCLLRECMKDFNFQKQGEVGSYLVYDGPLGFGVDNNQLGINIKEFRKFATELRVEGGRKSIKKNWLFVRPYERKRLMLRIPEEMYELVKRCAKDENSKPSTIIKDAIGEKLLKWLATKKKSEKEEQAIEYA